LAPVLDKDWERRSMPRLGVRERGFGAIDRMSPSDEKLSPGNARGSFGFAARSGSPEEAPDCVEVCLS